MNLNHDKEQQGQKSNYASIETCSRGFISLQGRILLLCGFKDVHRKQIP